MRERKLLSQVLVVVCVCCLFVAGQSQFASACSTLVAGKNATKDGAVLLGTMKITAERGTRCIGRFLDKNTALMRSFI